MTFEKIKIKDLKIGNQYIGFLFCTQIIESTTASGSSFCTFELMDGEAAEPIRAKMWNTSKAQYQHLEHEIIGLQMKIEEYKGAPSPVIERCGTASNCPYQKSDFIVTAPIESERMFHDILNLVDKSVSVKEGSLAELTRNIYNTYKVDLLKWSAAEKIHHNMYGGLLYHNYRMVRQAEVLTQVYPSLNAELLLSATALHDIGKLKELITDDMGNATYSVEGQLFGHIHIGMCIIDEFAAKGNYDPEKIMCLKHCIAAHHGKMEWGSIAIPKLEEASVLHYIDMIDSRIQQFETLVDAEPGNLTEKKIFGLDNSKIYKPAFKEKRS